MARPKARELTERELEIMHVFWDQPDEQSGGESAEAGEPAGLEVANIRDALAERGRKLAHTTVATLVRILAEKEFVEQTRFERPYRYRATKTFEEVSGSLVGEMLEKVFSGSREAMLVRLFGSRKLTKRERRLLEDILRKGGK